MVSSCRYEDIKILDDGEYPGAEMIQPPPYRNHSARSVGNLHMAWDESDMRYIVCDHIYVHCKHESDRKGINGIEGK